MSSLASPRIALALLGLGVGLMLLAIPLAADSHQASAGGGFEVVLVSTFGLVGATVAVRRPRHPTGWILIGIAISFAVSTDASIYSTLVYRDHDSLPFGWAAVLLQPTWSSAIVLFGLAVLLFPDGHLPAPWWRWVLGIYLTFAAVWMFGAFLIAAGALIAGHIQIVDNSGDIRQINDPTGVAVAWGDAQQAFFAVLFAVLLLWVCGQVAVFRRSTGEHRQQMKWLLGGALVSVVGAAAAFSGAGSWISDVGLVAVIALPVALGIGILKYRLYDIDVIIRRTLVYAILIAILAALYLAGISILDRALQAVTGQSSALAVTVSTLAIAVTFQPLRVKIQRLVDRRFDRSKYDSERILTAFTGTLRSQIDLVALETEVMAVIHTTVRPQHASLWLRQAGDPDTTLGAPPRLAAPHPGKGRDPSTFNTPRPPG